MKSYAAQPLPSKEERLIRFGSVPPIPGNKPTTKEKMSDLQNRSHDYLFNINQVGICKVRHPIQIRSELIPDIQTTVAELTLTTSLQRESKGINMSRLTELLERYRREKWEADFEGLQRLAAEMAEYMEQTQAEIELEFPWFYERSSPVLGMTGLNHSQASMKVIYAQGNPLEFVLKLQTAVTTLCPCSKEISEYSAHNQRGNVTVTVELDETSLPQSDWKTLLLDAIESNASSPLHPVLKRPDEKAVTERAYENPRFVEDMARLVAADLYEMDFVKAFKVECRNEESIHLHDALAVISFDNTTEAAL
ncbi:GTP cyclohydrolase FolE2 [Paenibacillus physcomitrellae]|uniref:GTP cyclohydrolase FolE2 n=1 Tax=Paenibacillus physcomitrellae TaxID=1619311 RepID=A0ABQ1FT63_9BACL|nr:GTP cyclohydrolase FolE2 [Paenibacillus physcomitrellae]GGA29554.1 GTP cyclohydrolase FolE2 [Paenibacillus physcomitrellae]